jgi:hypothetical protein
MGRREKKEVGGNSGGFQEVPFAGLIPKIVIVHNG